MIGSEDQPVSLVEYIDVEVDAINENQIFSKKDDEYPYVDVQVSEKKGAIVFKGFGPYAHGIKAGTRQQRLKSPVGLILEISMPLTTRAKRDEVAKTIANLIFGVKEIVDGK